MRAAFVNVRRLVVVAGTLAGVMGAGCVQEARAQAVTSAFTYQGRLMEAGSPASGVYDMQFRLRNELGVPIGPVVCANDVSVTAGEFTVVLDFGALFTGTTRTLEIGVRADTGAACGVGAYTTLSPQQALTATPHASYSLLAANANAAVSAQVASDALQLGGQPASFYRNASNLTSGTLPTARLGTTVVQNNINNTYTGTNSFTGVVNLSNAGNTYAGDGSGLAGLWRLGGNAGTNPATQFVGTTDNVPLQLRANNQPALRITPYATDTFSMIGGSRANTGAFEGATIGGGGSEFPLDERNAVTGTYGTIAGGLGNTAHSSAFVGGGFQNRATGWASAAGGSGNNALGQYSAIAGGQNNRIDNFGGVTFTQFSAIGGGFDNVIAGPYSVIAGGQSNQVFSEGAWGAIGGGANNETDGVYATVPGGQNNFAGGDYSFAAGRNASVRNATQAGDPEGDQGTFVWSDATGSLQSTGANQFLVRAVGGVGINTNAPAAQVHVVSSGANVALVENSSTAGGAAAVRGVITSTGPGAFSAGVRGVNNGTGGSGVGVYGSHAGSGWGVFGTAPLAGRAGYFSGNVDVSNTLTAAAKAFRIDHPLDPANKELWHVCVESPDMMTIYNGIVTTDASGYATVTLPTYFTALNGDYRYQLTVIDEADSSEFVWAKVVSKVDADVKGQVATFRVRTSVPHVEVSWQVTGIRRDAYAQQHRIVPEVEKAGQMRGTYINPEVFGLPRVVVGE